MLTKNICENKFGIIIIASTSIYSYYIYASLSSFLPDFPESLVKPYPPYTPTDHRENPLFIFLVLIIFLSFPLDSEKHAFPSPILLIRAYYSNTLISLSFICTFLGMENNIIPKLNHGLPTNLNMK